MSSEINKLNAISFSLIYSKVSPGEKKKDYKDYEKPDWS